MKDNYGTDRIGSKINCNIGRNVPNDIFVMRYNNQILRVSK